MPRLATCAHKKTFVDHCRALSQRFGTSRARPLGCRWLGAIRAWPFAGPGRAAWAEKSCAESILQHQRTANGIEWTLQFHTCFANPVSCP